MEGTNLKEILSYSVENLVEFPDQIVITEVETAETYTLQLRVAESDMGKVIGRQGRIAKEIRAIVKGAGSKSPKKIMVDILD